MSDADGGAGQATESQAGFAGGARRREIESAPVAGEDAVYRVRGRRGPAVDVLGLVVEQAPGDLVVAAHPLDDPGALAQDLDRQRPRAP